MTYLLNEPLSGSENCSKPNVHHISKNSCKLKLIIKIFSWLNNFPAGFIDFIIAITMYVQDLYSQKVTNNVRYFIIANYM